MDIAPEAYQKLLWINLMENGMGYWEAKDFLENVPDEDIRSYFERKRELAKE